VPRLLSLVLPSRMTEGRLADQQGLDRPFFMRLPLSFKMKAVQYLAGPHCTGFKI
jgi:hypothetical protein